MIMFSGLELRNATSPSSEDKLVILLTKIKQLGQDYFGSPHCFPIGMNCYFYIELLFN